jgi:hypothetical protein
MQGTLYIGARVGYSVNVEQNAVRVSVSLEDNQALLKRMTIDMPVSYDYWRSSDAAKIFCLGSRWSSISIHWLPMFRCFQSSTVSEGQPLLGVRNLVKLRSISSTRLRN